MSFLRNEQCPECAKRGRDRHRDNLGVYADGSKYCWSCGYHVNANPLSAIKCFERSTPDTPSVLLPSDVDTYIPAVARQWLGKYALTEYDVIDNRLMWSEYWKQLIFPYFDKYGNLVAWQGRSFAEPTPGRSRPKWFSQGDLKKLYHILPIKETYSGPVVLVEDVVSAIIVSRVCAAMPIFGSTVSLERLITLKSRCSGVVLFLDPDMKKKAIHYSRLANSIGFSSRVILAEKDPKDFSVPELQKLLDK